MTPALYDSMPAESEFVPLATAVAESRQKERSAEEEVMNQHRERAREESQRNEAEWTVAKRTTPVFAAYCFFCEYGNRAYDSTDLGCNPYVTMLAYIESEFAHANIGSLSKDVARYVNKHVWEPSRDPDTGESDIPFTTAAMVQEHIEVHNINPLIILGDNIRINRDIINILKPLIKERASANVNHRAIDSIIKLQASTARMISMADNRLLFGGGANGFRIDPALAGRIGNTRRVAPLLRRGGGGAAGGGAAAAPVHAAPEFNPVLGGRGARRRGGAEDNDDMDVEPLPL